jgi:hypothetical protein
MRRFSRAVGFTCSQIALLRFLSMNNLIVATLAKQRFDAAMLAAMAGLALVLSAIGLFGQSVQAFTEKTDTPKLAADLIPGTYKYKGLISVDKRQIPLTMSTTIRKEDGDWTVSDTVDLSGTPMTDVVTLEQGTLILRKRHMTRGPVSLNLDFTGNKARGNVHLIGIEKSIVVDLGGPLFADAAGRDEVIGCLPLREGYATTYRNFDVQKQKVKILQLKVAGIERVTVPAGTFNAFRVEIVSADGGGDHQTLWIAKDSRKPVKVSRVLAEMDGAVLTEELVP